MATILTIIPVNSVALLLDFNYLKQVCVHIWEENGTRQCQPLHLFRLSSKPFILCFSFKCLLAPFLYSSFLFFKSILGNLFQFHPSLVEMFGVYSQC